MSGDCDARDTIRFATMFRLGCDDDDDRRQYVVVARQYGSPSYPIQPWAVHDVDPDRGVVTDSRKQFVTQAAALDYGYRRLAELRHPSPNRSKEP